MEIVVTIAPSLPWCYLRQKMIPHELTPVCFEVFHPESKGLARGYNSASTALGLLQMFTYPGTNR